MQLSFEQISSLATGVVKTVITPDGMEFHRFTDSQVKEFDKPLKYFENNDFFNGYFSRNCRTCAGVTLDFLTDSSFLNIYISKNEHVNDSSEGNFDIYINRGHSVSCPADGNIRLDLGKGEKRVTVVFPYYNFPTVSAVEADCGAFFRPIGKNTDILCVGDSITQGVAANSSGNIWSMVVSRKCNIHILNQANSGYVYNAEVLEKVCEPKVIIAAYGTNDCNYKSCDELYTEACEFIEKLKTLYAESAIIGVLPPHNLNKDCRTNIYEKSPVLERAYRELHIRTVDGKQLIPEDKRYFSEDGTHPNDCGYISYGNAISNYLLNEGLIDFSNTAKH